MTNNLTSTSQELAVALVARLAAARKAKAVAADIEKQCTASLTELFEAGYIDTRVLADNGVYAERKINDVYVYSAEVKAHQAEERENGKAQHRVVPAWYVKQFGRPASQSVVMVPRAAAAN